MFESREYAIRFSVTQDVFRDYLHSTSHLIHSKPKVWGVYIH